MSTTPTEPPEPFELALDQYIAGTSTLPALTDAFHAGRLYILSESEPNVQVAPPPVTVRNADGVKLFAAFTSATRAKEWGDPRYRFTFWITTPDALGLVRAGNGLVLNPGSTTGIEVSPAGVDHLRAGRPVAASEVRVRRNSLR